MTKKENAEFKLAVYISTQSSMFWVGHETVADAEDPYKCFGNVEYAFIAITPRSILIRISSTREGPIYGSNRTT